MIRKILLCLVGMVLALDTLYAYNQDEREHNGAVIFMYHRFGESKYPSTNITMEQFEKHLKYLAQNKYKVWTLSKLVSYILEKKEIPRKVVVLTIDDAYKSVYTHAFARLKAYGFPCTIFVNTSPVDNNSQSYMSWDEMRSMQYFGIEFANHSKTHDSMLPKDHEERQRWEKRIREEIEGAQKRLQEELGAQTNENPRLFSYPFGEYTQETAEYIQSLGYIGVTQTSGAVGRDGDTKRIPRFPMAEAFADMSGFTLKLKTVPMPIESLSSIDPLVGKENPPRLTIKLRRSIKNIGCYLSSGEAIPMEWNSQREFSVQAKERLQGPREKYTCTAQATEGKWYWYSHFWIIK